ncbi:MAG: hypothetical protein LC799_24000, partial [Actinobacteria bacterium]|nr:hypothetical protein [Actinomycetota bacterium]
VEGVFIVGIGRGRDYWKFAPRKRRGVVPSLDVGNDFDLVILGCGIRLSPPRRLPQCESEERYASRNYYRQHRSWVRSQQHVSSGHLSVSIIIPYRSFSSSTSIKVKKPAPNTPAQVVPGNNGAEPLLRQDFWISRR